MTNKSEEKSKAEGSKVELEKDLAATNFELEQLASYKGELHAGCDFVLKNFEVRQTARMEEVEALKQAKAILSGAKFESLVQAPALVQVSSQQAPEEELAKEMTHDLEMNFNKIAPFGKEDTAKELQDHAAKTQDTLVDAVENA